MKEVNYMIKKVVWVLWCWYSPPLSWGCRFLYRIQQEQKQHNITVIMTMAATTPNITPNNNGRLQQGHKTILEMNIVY
jgi:hypothetical protein